MGAAALARAAAGGEVVQPVQKYFGEVLRRRRERARLTQEALAARAGLHRNYIGLLERGRRVPSLVVIDKLAAALQTTMANLLRSVESARRRQYPGPIPNADDGSDAADRLASS